MFWVLKNMDGAGDRTGRVVSSRSPPPGLVLGDHFSLVRFRRTDLTVNLDPVFLVALVVNNEIAPIILKEQKAT